MRYVIVTIFSLLLLGCSSSSPTPKKIEKRVTHSQFVAVIDRGDTQEVEKFLTDGFEINRKNDNNMTLISYSLKKEREEIAKILLKHGAKITSDNGEIIRVLMSSNDFGKSSLAQAIIDSLPDKPEAYLAIAIQFGNHEMFNFLLDNGYKIDLKLTPARVNLYLVNRRYRELEENFRHYGLDGLGKTGLYFMSSRAQKQLLKIVDRLYRDNSLKDKQKEKIANDLKKVGEYERAGRWLSSMKKSDNTFTLKCLISAHLGSTDKKACHTMLLFALNDAGRASWAYLLLSRYDDAIAAAQRAIDKKKMYYAYSNMGHAYLLKGKKVEAYRAYKNYFIKLNSVYALESLKDDFDLLSRNYPEKKSLFEEAYNAAIEMDTIALEATVLGG